MDELLEFLKKNPVFFLATDDNGQPRVRPFGFHMIFDGKFYMVTANVKKFITRLKTIRNLNFVPWHLIHIT